MNYRRLVYFLAVIDAGTVTAAAQSIPIAQPALSRQIKTLERELRFELFETVGNRLALTAAGRAFVPAARRLISQTRELEGTAEALRSARIATLTLAATAASVRSFVAPFIATTCADDPVLLVRDTAHFDIPDALVQGADFIVTPSPPDPRLQSLALGSVALAAHVPSDHPWQRAGLSTITLEALCAERVILPSHHSVSRFVLDQALVRARLGLCDLLECDDGPTILALAAAGHGVGVTTEPTRFGAHALRIAEPNAQEHEEPGILHLPLYVAWPAEHFAAQRIAGLAERIRAFMRSRHEIILAE
jgi:DNA-binding transcriptional LysR family regulator